MLSEKGVSCDEAKTRRDTLSKLLHVSRKQIF